MRSNEALLDWFPEDDNSEKDIVNMNGEAISNDFDTQKEIERMNTLTEREVA